ncbi:MAG: STAS domain-containing protein [Bacteroidales bacterium]|nr:STAS domain-containing protein [Bacteroidales bacterium]
MEFKIKTDDVKKHYREYDISGDVSVQNIEDILSEMKNTITECDSLRINLNRITGFDTAALQFFYSLKNSFIREKKKFTVHCDLSEQVKQLLHNCGIDDLAKVLSIDTQN